MTDEYPEEWPAVAERVKAEHDWQCERCGHEHEPEPPWVLTVHHLDEDKSNLNDWNLAALCQRCHLQVQNKVDWYRDTLTGVHTEWMAEHVRQYNEWAREHGEPELRLTDTRPNRRPYWPEQGEDGGEA
jgi:hypothetical protein